MGTENEFPAAPIKSFKISYQFVRSLFGFLMKDPLLIWNNESRVKFLWGRTLVKKLLPACENQLSFCWKHEKLYFCNRRDWNIQVSGGSVTPKNLLKCMELIWYFQTVRGGGKKIPSVGEVWIFFWNYKIHLVGRYKHFQEQQDCKSKLTIRASIASSVVSNVTKAILRSFL